MASKAVSKLGRFCQPDFVEPGAKANRQYCRGVLLMQGTVTGNPQHCWRRAWFVLRQHIVPHDTQLINNLSRGQSTIPIHESGDLPCPRHGTVGVFADGSW